MAFRWKRGPVAFRPRLSAGLGGFGFAVVISSLYCRHVTNYLTRCQREWRDRVAACHHRINRLAAIEVTPGCKAAAQEREGPLSIVICACHAQTDNALMTGSRLN